MADLKISLSVDANNPNAGDLYINANGTIAITQTLSEQVAQAILIRIRFLQGEWFLDPTLGTPYFQAILGQKNALSVVTQIFRSIIAGVPGVASIMTLSPVLAGRSLAITFAVKLNDGQILKSSDFMNSPFVVPIPPAGPSGGASQ